MHIGKSLKEKLSYRKSMLVHSAIVYQNNNMYAKCPKCNNTIDRDFQDFCSGCGQCLNWDNFPSNVKIII